MKRMALYLVLALSSFVVTVLLRGGFTNASESGVVATSARVGRSDRAGAAAESARGVVARLPARRRVVVTNEGLRAFQKLELEQPQQASALRNALVEATAKSRYDRHVSLEECATAKQLPGAQTLKFRAAVTSDGTRFRAEPWRFVEVVDGSEIPAGVIACMEQAMGGPYEGERPDYAPFPVFDGDIDLTYRLPAFSGAGDAH